jgi:hypothetical protein
MHTRTARHIVTWVVQCGSCFVGWGIPEDAPDWTAVLLPLAAGVPYRIETLDLVDDQVKVWCEHEMPAM